MPALIFTSVPREFFRVALLGSLLMMPNSLPSHAQAPTSAAPTAEPALSPAETAVIDRKIATLHSSADRSISRGWSNSRKVAEVLCRHSAIPILKKQLPGTDRVFLGTGDPKTLSLESNARLTGTGTARTPAGWQDFSFSCKLDPARGEVTSFEAVVTGASQPAK